MRLVITDDVGTWAADYVVKRIHQFAPTAERLFVLGLPTGNTPLGMYAKLGDYYRQGRVSFIHVVTFNLDEYVGLPAEHPASYHAYMARHFFNRVDIPPDQTYIPNGNAADLGEECDRCEATLQSYGGINLCVGGVGVEGHIAFNESGASLQSRTRSVTLAPSTRQANARHFNHDLEKVPPTALTLGLGTILESQEVMILAQGTPKAQAIAQALAAKVNPLWPISTLQLHPQALLVCDQAATVKLNAETIQSRQTHPNPL